MKKFLLWAAVFAVCSHAISAEPTFTWSVYVGAGMGLSGFSEYEKYTDAYGNEHEGKLGEGGDNTMPWTYLGFSNSQQNRILARFAATVANEEGTMGAWFEMRSFISNHSGVGYAWWQPVEQFKVRLGTSSPTEGDPFTLFLVNDDFYPIRQYGSAVSSVIGGTHYWWNPQRVHHGYGRESIMAATFEFFPLPNLYITTSTPFESHWSGARGGASTFADLNALDVLAQTAAQISYKLPEIGIVALTWDGGTMQVDQNPLLNTTWLPGNSGGLFYDDPAFITAGFTFTRLYDPDTYHGAMFYIGFDAPLPSSTWRSGYVETQAESVSARTWYDGSENRNEVIVQRHYGAEVRGYFGSSSFQVVGGVAVNFGGYTAYKPEGGSFSRVDMPLTIGATVNPNFDFGVFDTGLVLEAKYHAQQDNIAEPYTVFNIVPYVQKNISNGVLWAGVQIEGLALDNSDELNPNAMKVWKYGINWSVPIGLRFYL